MSEQLSIIGWWWTCNIHPQDGAVCFVNTTFILLSLCVTLFVHSVPRLFLIRLHSSSPCHCPHKSVPRGLSFHGNTTRIHNTLLPSPFLRSDHKILLTRYDSSFLKHRIVNSLTPAHSRSSPQHPTTATSTSTTMIQIAIGLYFKNYIRSYLQRR